VVLPGHLAAPSARCFALPGVKLGPLAARALRSRDTQGDVVAATFPSPDEADLVVVHPGGAVLQQQLSLVNDGLIPTPGGAAAIASGRDLLYVAGTRSGDGSSSLVAVVPPQTATVSFFGFGGQDKALAYADGAPLAVLEPSGRDLHTWTLFGGAAPALWSWSQDVYTPITAPDEGCQVTSAALSPGLMTLVAGCSSGQLEFATGPMPPDVTAGVLTWYPLGGAAGISTARALASGAVVGSSSDGIFYGSLADVVSGGQPALPVHLITPKPSSAFAVSPDGTQALVGDGASIEIEQRLPDGSWTPYGVLDTGQIATVEDLCFDAAGSHAVAVLRSLASGSLLCEIR